MEKHMPVRLVNCSVLHEDGVHPDTTITIDAGVITALNGFCQGDDIDCQGGLIIPGAVDVHCDALEKIIESRPGVTMPMQHVMPQADRLYASAGISTIYHAVSFADHECSVRSVAMASAIARDIASWQPYAAIDHRLHARYEVTDAGGYDAIVALIDEGAVDLLSIMDHSIGQGQFQTFEAFNNYYGRAYKLSVEEVMALAEAKNAAADEGWERVADLVRHARGKGVAVASHDDDSEQRVQFISALGGTISEFPINLDTARYAHAAGLCTIMGAPNMVRGGSQSGNMRALDAVLDGCLDALCADYVPWTMLAAAFALPDLSQLSLPQTIDMVAAAPARAVGLTDRGRIAEGMRADLVQVALVRGLPQVVSCWSAGREAYRSQPPQVQAWPVQSELSL